MKNFTMLILVVASLFVYSSEGALGQQTVKTASVKKAKTFMASKANGKFVTEFAHMGATYRSHSIIKATKVKGSNGRIVPGKFALVCNFVWESNGRGVTKIAFFFDRDGNLESTSVLNSNGYINSPFTFADATIQVLGQALVEAFRDKMTTKEARKVESLVRAANSKGLLEFGLKFRQAAGY